MPTTEGPMEDLKATAGAPRTDELQRGQRIGRYTVLERVGVGSTGAVYAAYDSTLDRKVAVKIVRRELGDAGRGARSARLLREARAMAQLGHAHVVVVHEVGEFDGGVFLAME